MYVGRLLYSTRWKRKSTCCYYLCGGSIRIMRCVHLLLLALLSDRLGFIYFNNKKHTRITRTRTGSVELGGRERERNSRNQTTSRAPLSAVRTQLQQQQQQLKCFYGIPAPAEHSRVQMRALRRQLQRNAISHWVSAFPHKHSGHTRDTHSCASVIYGSANVSNLFPWTTEHSPKSRCRRGAPAVIALCVSSVCRHQSIMHTFSNISYSIVDVDDPELSISVSLRSTQLNV